jgi:Flp pilus assembly protein CpaB
MTTAPLDDVPRRLHRRRATGVHLVMVLAAVLGFVLTLTALRGERSGRRVAVAVRELEAGTVLRRRDLRFERVRAADGLLAHLLSPDEVRRLRGHIVTTPVAAGEPVVDSRIRPPAASDGRRAMSIPVDRARAVNGRLAPGDRVDVVAAVDGSAFVVAAGLEVLDVESDADGALGARRAEVTVTLAVDVRESQVLTAALARGDFVLTRVTGATPASAAVPTTLAALMPGAGR